jgi:hypothetical protein
MQYTLERGLLCATGDGSKITEGYLSKETKIGPKTNSPILTSKYLADCLIDQEHTVNRLRVTRRPGTYCPVRIQISLGSLPGYQHFSKHNLSSRSFKAHKF